MSIRAAGAKNASIGRCAYARHPLPGKLEISRLRAGEVISGLSGAVLLGWGGRRQLPVIRWLAPITGVSAVALPYTQAARAAPALPVALSVVVTVLGGATGVGLVGRVLIRPSSRSSAVAGAHVGLLAALGVAAGGYVSMRQEDGTDPAELGELEIIRV